MTPSDDDTPSPDRGDDRAGGSGDAPAREQPAQLGPPDRLDGFPVARLAPASLVHRAHDRDRGPWWFSGNLSGRFDLPAPQGSCYLASTAVAAVRERLGPVLAARTTLPASTLEHVVVSQLTLGTDEARAAGATVRLANLRVAAAGEYGVTRELESMTPYEVPQRWASAFAVHGLDGVRYGPRFTPGTASALAVFGIAGEDRSRPHDPRPVLAADVPGVPEIVDLPRRRDLKIIRPPGRGRVSRSR